MRINRLLFIGMLSLVLGACSGTQPGSPDTEVFLVEDIDNRQIESIWIEIPSDLSPGSNKIRLFMARPNPPGMLVPTETELPCIIQTEGEYMDLRSVSLLVDFDIELVKGIYTRNACASCIECYLDRDKTLEFNA